MDILYKAFPDSLNLRPIAKRPVELTRETVRSILSRPAPQVDAGDRNAATGERPDPLVSVVVVTWNNLVFTRLCLESLLANTPEPSYELIVVDNGSTDGTPNYLRVLARLNPQVRVIFNSCNHGFARANNQGLAIARGTQVVLLNNDTVVTGCWLPRLVKHLEAPSIGVVSPVTNSSGNESEIATSYDSYGTLLRFSEDRYASHHGRSFDTSSLIMFCAAMRRETWAEIGPLDERFEVGMFEDDDYAMRLKSARYRIVCAEDTFIHHFGQATIGKLSRSGEYGALFHANRERWEEKWGRAWLPHRRRPDPGYVALVQRIQRAARDWIPPGAAIAIVSNGDDELLNLGGYRAMHFPCDAHGVYAGYHPRDSREAIAHIEVARKRRADYLIVPSTSFWWLDYYGEFRRHLERNHQLLAHDPDIFAVYALLPSNASTQREEHSFAQTD